MEQALLKVSHDKYWLLPGYLLGLQFLEGWVCFRIRSREFSRLRPFSIGNIATLGHLANPNTIADAGGRRYLEPHKQDYLVHSFGGVNKPKARVYLSFPSDVRLGTLKGIELNVGNDWGYFDGDASPYEGPYAPESEIIAVYERYPAIDVYNPTSDLMTNVLLSFEAMKYSYTIITEPKLVREILLGSKARKYTIGKTEPSPASIPQWLQKLVGADLLAQTVQVMKEGG